MAILDFIRGAGATTASLRTQKKKARTAQQEAEQVLERAREVFDESGDAPTEEALETAERDLAQSIRHAERAERLLAAAEKKDEAKRRSDLKKEGAILEAELSSEAVTKAAQPLIELEAQAVMKLGPLRAKRLELLASYQEKVRRLSTIRRELGIADASFVDEQGHPPTASPRPDAHIGSSQYTFLTAERVKVLIKEAALPTPIWRYLEAIADAIRYGR